MDWFPLVKWLDVPTRRSIAKNRRLSQNHASHRKILGLNSGSSRGEATARRDDNRLLCKAKRDSRPPRNLRENVVQLARVRSHLNLQLKVKAGASVMAEWG